jgi:hypothetical protein
MNTNVNTNDFVHSSYKEIVRHVKSVHSIYFGFKIKCCHPACELEFKIHDNFFS